MNVELSAKSTDSCGHLTFRQKIQGERKISIVINANMNWKVPVSDIINLEWPIKQPSTRERSTSADPIWRCRSDQCYGKVLNQPPRKTIWPPTLEPNWASQLIDEIMPGKLLTLKALNLNGLTNSHPRRPLASTGTRTPTWRSTPVLPSQDALQDGGGREGRQNRALSGTEGVYWAWRDSGRRQPHQVNYNEKVTLEQLVADNVSSRAMILHISIVNKVGENQWKFHVLTSGKYFPELRY